MPRPEKKEYEDDDLTTGAEGEDQDEDQDDADDEDDEGDQDDGATSDDQDDGQDDGASDDQKEKEVRSEDDDAGGEDEEERERVREQRRRKKKAQRAHQKEERARLQSTIENQNRMISEFHQQISTFRQDNFNNQINGIGAQKADVASKLQMAQQAAAKAATEGDTETLHRAMEVRLLAERRLQELDALENSVKAQYNKPSALDEDSVRLREEWVRKNSWAKTPGLNQSIAQGLATELESSGYRPSTREFWNELDRRLQDYLPEYITGVRRQKRDRLDDARQPSRKSFSENQPKRSTPPPQTVGGGGKRPSSGGSDHGDIPRYTVDQWKKAGLWDDPEKRKTAIAQFRDYQAREKGR